MERTRTPSDSWDTREFVPPLPPAGARDDERAPVMGPSAPSSSGDGQREKGTTAGAASATPATPAARHLHQPASRFTIRPPSRSLGKYTLRQSSPPSEMFANMVGSSSLGSSSSGSLFELSSSNSHYGTALEGSESDASMDAEVASLTNGRRLGNGVEGLLRAVDAPSRPRRDQPRSSDAGSSASVSLFALLTPSPVERRETQTQRGSKAAPVPGYDSAAQQEGGVWGMEPAAKRRRTRKVPSPVPRFDMKE